MLTGRPMFASRPSWDHLPEHVRGWVDRVLGSPVVDAVTQPGGFSPGTADRVLTADGRRAFVKAVSAEANPDSVGLHRREIGVLQTLAGHPGVAQLIASHDDGTWVALVIEDIEGRHPHLPWTHPELASALHTLTRVAHTPAPVGWPRLEEELRSEFLAWQRIGSALEEYPDLDPWLREHVQVLCDLSAGTLPRMAGDVIVHTDVRADNMLLTPDGDVVLVDWPWACSGAPWADAAMLLVNVRWSGDLDVRPHLPVLYELGASHADICGVIAGLTGFCVEAMRRPAPAGIPTLRQFQADQARAGLVLLQELWD